MKVHTLNPSRALYYDFFANIFLYELLIQNCKLLQEQINLLSQQPLCDESFYKTIQDSLERDFPSIQTQYTKLFALPFKAPIFLYLSHYKEGCVGGESLLLAKTFLKELGFILDHSFTKENEDHFGILCLLMRFLILQNNQEEAQKLFDTCIKPMGKHIADDIAKQTQSGVYFAVAKILKEFMDFEEDLYHALT